MNYWRVRDEESLQNLCESIRAKLEEKSYVDMVERPMSHTPSQSRLIHHIYSEVAKQKGDESAEQIKYISKLHYGVPILRSHSEEFRTWYDEKVKPLPYPAKLVLMEHLDVIKELEKVDKGVSDYIDALFKGWADQGIYVAKREAL